LVAIKQEYGDKRRTRIEGAIDILTEVDLIPDEEVVVTLTRKGYIKRVPLGTYGVQHRGGKGKMGMQSLDEGEDVIEDLFVARTHDNLLFFTNLGRVYGLQVFEVPEGSRIAKGRAIINLLPLTPGEHVVKLLCTRDLSEGTFIVMLTKNGIIKRTDASEFAHIRATGIRAATLKDNDELVFCDLSSGNDSIIIATAQGQGIRFNENEVRSMGRQAAGVIGIRLKKNDYVVGMQVLGEQGDILFATENGYGKRVSIADFRVAHRGGLGVRTIPADKRNGRVIGLAHVTDNSNLLLIDQVGKIIRLPSSEVRTMGRQAKGVRLIRLDEGQKLSSVVAFEEDTIQGSNGGGGNSGGDKNLTITGSKGRASHAMAIDESEQDQIHTAYDQEENEEITPSVSSDDVLVYAQKSNDSEYDPFAGF
jgi:DNA gyrase subunit A